MVKTPIDFIRFLEHSSFYHFLTKNPKPLLFGKLYQSFFIGGSITRRSGKSIRNANGVYVIAPVTSGSAQVVKLEHEFPVHMIVS